MSATRKQLFAFVLMPFDSKFNDLYKLGIKDVAAKLGVTAERVDEQRFTESMLERIYSQINAADIVIAEMTGQNPNVFYEVGYAHAKDKLCILSTADVTDIPFDLKHRRHIIHSNSIVTLGQQITTELEWARGVLEQREKNIIRVKITPTAELDRHAMWDVVKLTLKIDLHNDLNTTSPEIDAMYLTSGRNWTFSQDGQECGKTIDESKPNDTRHLLKSPVRKLQRHGWAQVTIVGRKYEFRNEGEPVPDSYPVKGTAPFEIATSAGNLTYDFTLDVSANEIPF